jgi:hypothetical protein
VTGEQQPPQGDLHASAGPDRGAHAQARDGSAQVDSTRADAARADAEQADAARADAARADAARADAARADAARADVSDLIGEARRRVRVGTIELIAATIVALALIALAVWFFGFAHNPCCSR